MALFAYPIPSHMRSEILGCSDGPKSVGTNLQGSTAMKHIDRAVETEVLESELRQALEENSGADARAFVASILSLVPDVGGALGKLVVAGDEKQQQDKLRLLLAIARNTGARLNEVDERLAVLMDRERLFSLKVVLETSGVIGVTESHGASSVTDNGELDFTINFTERIWPYTFSTFGSGQVDIVRAVPTEHSLRLQLASGAPDRVAVVVLPG